MAGRKHKQCAMNGMLHGNLCKSKSNITFLCDMHPFITENPLYQDGVLSSPDTSIESHRLDTEPLSPMSSRSQMFSWSFPSRIRGGGNYGRRRSLWDPTQWEVSLEGLKAELKDSREELDVDMEVLSGRSTKLSVREQARQFEQQARAERTPRASLDLDDILATINPPYSPMSVGKDVPPCIILTGSHGETPPLAPSQRPTPPVLRKFSSSISSYVIVEPCEVLLEIIPDVPDTPPPPPPTFPIVHSPSPPLATPSIFSPSPPPTLPTVSSPHHSPHDTLSTPPRLHTSTPPPVPSPFFLSSVRNVLAKLHPVPLESEGLQRELRGILKYSHNETGQDKSLSSPNSCRDRSKKLKPERPHSVMLTESESDEEYHETSQMNPFPNSTAEDSDSKPDSDQNKDCSRADLPPSD